MTLELRPLSPDDGSVVHRILRAAEVVDGAPFATTLDEVEEQYLASHLRPVLNGRLALLDGEPVGFALVDHHPSGERLERAHLFGTVDPAHRRTGVGAALFEWELGRATEVLGAYEHDLPRYARAYQRDVQRDATALYERFGLRPVRYTDQLLRLLDLPSTVEVDDGVEILPWDDVRSEEIRQVKNAAFADHWGTTPTTPAAWAHWTAESTKRLDLSFIAVADGEVVGYSLSDHYASDVEITGRRDGWISHLGVLREHRRRGIASSLIAASIEAFRGAGFTHAMLAVDSENPSGAHHLYRRLGFEPFEREVVYEVEVPRRTT